ncbi:MAG: type VI secretion system baseplate subunit TssK [candidate division Zixibacteria bacterium]|nr:type VI secretion system baseplate subunit TssK [candidate division Zixibacteria bacterium]
MDDVKKFGRLLSVNWEDGMLVKADHLIAQEVYFEALNRWVIRHSINSYGLAKTANSSSYPLDMRVEHDGRNWVIVLSRCHGLTAGGSIIQIDSQYDDDIRSAAIPVSERSELPVYIYARPEKVGVGLPVGGDELMRRPYRGFDYEIIIGQISHVDPADCLQIGTINFADGRPQLSPDYIPPAMTTSAHPLLAEQNRRLIGLLTVIQQSAVSGFQAFASVVQDKPGKFGIEHTWLRDILSNLAIQLGGLIKIHPNPDVFIHPYQLFDFYKRIFGIVEAMLETYHDAAVLLKKKYGENELYKRFIADMKEFANSKYNHNELGPQTARLIKLMNDFAEFINLIKNLAGALPQVGQILTYRNREYRLQQFAGVQSQIERDGVIMKIEGLGNIVSRDILVSISRDLFTGVDYRYIMVKIGLNDNSIPGRMDPVYVDADTSPGNLILKPMDDLADSSIVTINLNFRGNFNAQELKAVSKDTINVYVY